MGNSHGDNLLKILSLTNLKDKIYFNIASPKKRYGNYDFQVSNLLKFLKEKKAIISFYDNKFLKRIYDSNDGDFF